MPHNITRSNINVNGRAASSGPAVIEIVVVVDKEFADLFQQDFQKIIEYLTIYFWDINMRYKTIWSIDISIRINGVLIMEVKFE